MEFAPLILTQPPNQRCRQNYALILLPLILGCPLSLNHLLSTQLLTVCFFRGLPSAIDKHKGIGHNGYDNAFPSQWVCYSFAENESKDPIIK